MSRTLFIAGDSTAALKGAAEKPMTGWGEHLQKHFLPSIRVDNRAINGRSTKSFLHEGRLAAIEQEIQAGDYLFIQFGHNDGKQEDPARYADPERDYPENLSRFIESARRRGAIPILLTSVSRRKFLPDGSPDPAAVEAYPEVMRKVALTTGTVLLDIFTASQRLYSQLGVDESSRLFMHLPAGLHPNYPDGISDNTHFSELGARQIAELVVAEIREHPELADLAAELQEPVTSSIPPQLNLGVRAHDFGVLPLDELLAKVNYYGFTNAQLAVGKSFPDSVPKASALSPGSAAYYGGTFRRAGIHIAVLGCYVNIIAPDPVKREEALNSFATHLRLARDFGASLVGTETGSVGAGYTPDNFTEEAYQAVVDSVRRMVAEAERFGVTVGIEAGQNHPLHSAPLVYRLLEDIPSGNLQIILDCANLMSPDNCSRQAEIVAEALQLLGDRIAVVHLKDFILEDGKIVIVPPGQGKLDFRPILRYMKYQRPHIHGILESTPESGMMDSIAYLTRIYEEV